MTKFFVRIGCVALAVAMFGTSVGASRRAIEAAIGEAYERLRSFDEQIMTLMDRQNLTAVNTFARKQALDSLDARKRNVTEQINRMQQQLRNAKS